jgi:intracellular sulfur oxidation DsrE/DsrF family protein
LIALHYVTIHGNSVKFLREFSELSERIIGYACRVSRLIHQQGENMKRMPRILTSLVLALAALPVFASPAAHKDAPKSWQYPLIKNHGRVMPLPNAALRPDKHATYKAVFSVNKNPDSAKVNPGLEHVARATNLFALSGVERAHRKLVVVIYGPATAIVVNNKPYRQRTGHDNPNIKLIHKLKQAGVKLYVCGQALAEAHIPHGEVNDDVTVSLSALTDLIILQKRGYSLFPF